MQVLKDIQHSKFSVLYIYTYIYCLNTSVVCDMQVITTSAYVIILTSVIFGHKFQTIHIHIYVFMHNYNNVHFAYEIFCL